MIEIKNITIDKLKNGEFAKELPEFYELKNIVENGGWHSSQSVFDHTIATLEELEKLFSKKYVRAKLSEKIEKATRRDLIFLATLFHDIAKKETMITGPITRCPGHEEAGYKKVKPILDRFILSDTEKEAIRRIIRYHDLVHHIVENKNARAKEDLDKLKIKFPDIIFELILLAAADTAGCDFGDNYPEDYKFRMDFFRDILKDNKI